MYGVEFEKRLRHSAARELNVKNVLEVLLDPNRRIALSDQKDAMGIPKPWAHYSIDDYTRSGHERSKRDRSGSAAPIWWGASPTAAPATRHAAC